MAAKKTKLARLDLFTGQVLADQNGFYKNRTNLINHFKKLSKEEILKITLDIIGGRKERRNLEYALYSTELKSIVSPSIALLEYYGLDYHEICETVGLKRKFLYDFSELKLNTDNGIKRIVVDTREQKPIPFKGYEILSQCLKVGDYCDCEDVTGNLVVERKALGDFISTLSSGYERFCREVERGVASNTNVVVMVEYPLSKSLGFNYLPQCQHTKCRPEFIFSRLREMMQKYSNIQFMFTKDRTESERVIPKLFNNKEFIFGYDLQLAYEKGIL